MLSLETNTINEPIKVLASFSLPKIQIHSFYWQERIYNIEATTMFHISHDQQGRVYHFSVTANDNAYELTFNPTTLAWHLKTVIAL